MDKYEYQVCIEQIQQLISEKRFVEAMEIADTIDWRRVRSVSKLITVSEIYKVNKRYEDAKDILLLAYEKHPNGRDIVFALCELFIKLGDTVQAVESYKEFMAIAPEDPNSCILLYKIYKSQGASLEEQIDVLEDLKRREYIEKWAYELANLYHLTGQEARCVSECDELILWFGEGKYVRKAMELKMQHTALTKDQQAKFDGRAVTANMPVFEQPFQQSSQFGNNAQQTGPMIDRYGEYLQQTGQITGQLADVNGYTGAVQPQQGTGSFQPQYQDPQMQYMGYTDAYGNPVQITPQMYADGSQPIQVAPEINHLGMTQDIMYQSLGTGTWSTVDLQEQLGSQVREVMGIDGQPQYQQEQGYSQQGLYNGYTGDVQGAQPPVQNEYVQPEVTGGYSIQDAGNDSLQTGDSAYVADGSEAPAEEIKTEPKKPEISVHTGVIDIKDSDLLKANLPGKSLPSEDSEDILSQLEGVIPGSSSDITVTGISSQVNAPKTKSRITGQIPAILPSVKDLKSDDEEEVKGTGYEIKDEPETEQDEISRISAIQEKAFPGSVVPEISVEPERDEEVKEDISEVSSIPSFFTVPDTISNPGDQAREEQFEVPEALQSVDEDDDIKIAPDRKAAEIKEVVAGIDTEETKFETKTSQDVPAFTEVSEEAGHYPYDTVADIGFVEELTEIEQPEDAYDILKTGKIPLDEISRATAYETDSVPEAEEYEIDEVDEEDDEESRIPSYMREDIRASREFDDDEYRIFCRYDGMENMKAQLVDALDTMSMDSSRGNIVIMGPESADCKGIAINIVKAMQSKRPEFSGKVAKISGEALNKKNIKGTLEKLENGALIVERAGGLTKETVLLITGALTEGDKPVLVILEGEREEIKPLFKYSKLMKKVFDARIDIAEFTDDDLVNYARGYALQQEYVIDDMGGLALHNRISEMQTFDHQVTIDEVKELVDMAIQHVDRKNVGHLMDMLLGRRYDDEDNIILSEKDFIF